jgi:hypothetical protein
MKVNIPTLSFGILLFAGIPLSADVAVSVIPGWHTTIYSPYIVWTIVFEVALLFASAGYWLIWQWDRKINWRLFIIHLVLTIPAMAFIKFPLLFVKLPPASEATLLQDLTLSAKLFSIARAGFIAGQVVFLVYFFKRIYMRMARG